MTMIVLDGEPDVCVRAFPMRGAAHSRLFEELKPDVLVLDGDLPNGDGLEVTTFLKERPLAVRILFDPATMLGPLGVTS